MMFSKLPRYFMVLTVFAALSGCGAPTVEEDPNFDPLVGGERDRNIAGGSQSIFDVLRRDRNETNVRVNRYIWAATLETLDFLPLESVDPFTGVIVTGYGTPPGGSRAYRATVLIKDPALDARSLNVALLTRSGPASVEAVRAVEDAILSRARQLRIADRRL